MLLPALGLLALAVATCVALVVLGVVDPLARSSAGATTPGASVGDGAGPQVGSEPALVAPSTRQAQARRILRGWDRARELAWARADAGVLRSLYVPGSRAAERDVAMLARWEERGLRVRHLRMRTAQLEVLAAGPQSWRLRVSDRVVGAYAVRAEAGRGTAQRATRVTLPRDRTTTRVLDLRQLDGRWLVAAVSRVT